MAKFIIISFLFLTTSGVSYLTYNGIGQEKIETLKTEQSIRSNSYRSSSSGSSSSYNSSSYGYGK